MGANGGDSPAWSRNGQPTSRPSASSGRAAVGALRRAALPLELQLPRRRLPPRGAGRGGGPARPRGPGPHRPRRLLRRRPLRRGGPGRRPAHGLRRRADPRLDAPATTGASRRSRAADAPVVLARDPAGYARLARAISRGQLAGEKGAPRITLDRAGRAGRRPGPLGGAHRLPQGGGAGRAGGRRAGGRGRRELAELVALFGRDHVAVELWDHGDPLDSARNDALAELARASRASTSSPPTTSTTPPRRQRRLATALAAVRARRSLDEIDGWLPAAPAPTCARGPSRPAASPATPAWSSAAAQLGLECAFDLQLVAPEPAAVPVPRTGRDEMSYLRAARGREGGRPERYGPPRPRRRVPGAYAQIDHELDLIEQLGFPGYFLVVWDIVRVLPASSDIFCQGRGSAANSAVCYALGITNADAVSLGLLFERFLSPERDGPPDIDLDIESDRREEVIQYVYDQLRPRPRRAGRQRHHLPRQVGGARHGQGARATPRASRTRGRSRSTAGGRRPRAGRRAEPRHHHPGAVLELAAQVEHFPRHLGIHSGGMVICDRPVIEVCPVEWGRMEDRTVLQWDKDDCAAVGLVKFDLLGLGMLSALHYAVDLIRDAPRRTSSTSPRSRRTTRSTTCSARPTRSACSRSRRRAQMATLPRLRAPHLLRPRGRGRAHPPRPDPGRVGAPLHPPPQRPGAGHLPAPAARAGAGEDPRRAAVPGAAHADGHRRRRVHPGRGRPAAPGHGLEAVARAHGAAAGPALRGHGRAGHRRRRWPTRSGTSSRPSPTTASPRATRCASPTSCTRRRGSSATTRRRSARRCSTPSRWASTRRTRWCRTPAATASRCAAPDLNASADRATWNGHPRAAARVPRRSTDGPDNGPGRPPARWGGRPRGPPRHRLGAGHRRRPGRARSPPAGPTPTWRTSCAPDRRDRWRSSRRWPPPAPSAASALDRREALWAAGAVAQSRPGRLAGVVTGRRAPPPAGHGAVRGGDRRPVGHRRVARRPPHPLRPRAPRPARRVHGRRAGVRAGGQGARGRGGHPPPAPGHRRRHDVRQPRGRDRPDQRGRVEGVLGPPPPGGPDRAGPAGAGPARTGRGRDQRDRRAHGAPAARRRPPDRGTSADLRRPARNARWGGR